MKIKFKTRNVYRENVLISASPESDALFELLKPRQHLKPSELIWVSKMGFEIEIVGEKRELDQEMKRMDTVRKYYRGRNSTMERHSRIEREFHHGRISFLKEE
jgi:hypothetical protein